MYKKFLVVQCEDGVLTINYLLTSVDYNESQQVIRETRSSVITEETAEKLIIENGAIDLRR